MGCVTIGLGSGLGTAGLVSSLLSQADSPIARTATAVSFAMVFNIVRPFSFALRVIA